MKAKVLKLENSLFDGEAIKIIVPATEGEMCILPNHISIFTSIRKGTIKIFRPNMDKHISIPVESGICSFSDNCAVFIL